MNAKPKTLIAALLIVITGALLYAPVSSAVQAASGNGEISENEDLKGLKLLWWILNRSEPETIEGKAIAVHNGFLLLDTESGQRNIALPEEWNVETTIVAREMLFERGYLNVNEQVTVRTLRIDIISKSLLSIYLSIGYEIIDETGSRAYAILPINIEA